MAVQETCQDGLTGARPWGMSAIALDLLGELGYTYGVDCQNAS
jgi:hypothetical protein